MDIPTSHPNLSRLAREQRLALYGLAVGAALTGASPAQANLITLDLSSVPVGDRSSAGSSNLYFDVNAASAAAAVSANPFAAADFRFGNGSVFGIGANLVQTFTLTNTPKAARLTTSNVVGPTGQFNTKGSIVPFNPAWAPGDTGFIGLKFQIGADFHFGWANLTENIDESITLNALGYESDPNTAAHVEPAAAGPGNGVPDQGSTLVLLATGAAGLLAFRKYQGKAA